MRTWRDSTMMNFPAARAAIYAVQCSTWMVVAGIHLVIAATPSGDRDYEKVSALRKAYPQTRRRSHIGRALVRRKIGNQ